MNDYRTVKDEAFDEYIVKKSRFIGYAKPVTTQEQATEFINQIKSKHWDATHNVYAYCLRDGQTRRYSDDGEPQGTAGIPALDVLLKGEITDCVVVCTRYFGGIMLGAGGLVRAYSHTAKIAVEAAGIITMSLCKIADVRCDYNYYGKLVPLICRHGGIVENTDFSDTVTVRFRIPAETLGRLNAEIIDTSFGKYSSVEADERYSVISE